MKPFSKKYILFDLDGTLTDPKIGICTSVQYSLASFGIEVKDIDELKPFIGPPLLGSFMKYYGFDEEKALQAVQKYRERFSVKGLYENEVYPGIPEMLKTISDAGMLLGIASSKPQEFVEKILAHFELSQYFRSVAGSRMNDPSEQKESSIRRCLGQFPAASGIRMEDCCLVGDRCYDVEGAHQLGMECIGAAYGYGSMDELKEASADYIVQSVGELTSLLASQSQPRPSASL